MSNPTILPVPTILNAGALGLSLSLKDISKKNVFSRGVINELIPPEIQMVYKGVKHRYDSYPSDTSLRATANLLWQLLGKYGLQALNALEGGGQVQIVTSGGLLLIPYSDQVQINSVDFPSGDTSFTLDFRSYGVKNSDVYVELENQPVSALSGETFGDFTYAITFNLTSTVISFSVEGTPTPPDDDQVMIIRGFKYS